MKKKLITETTATLNPFISALSLSTSNTSINMEVDMDGHSILNLKDGSDPQDALNHNYAEDLARNIIIGSSGVANFVLLSGSEAGRLIEGDIVFKDATVTNIADAGQPRDALPLRQLKEKINSHAAEYLPLSGGTMNAPLNTPSLINTVGTNDPQSGINVSQVETRLNTSLQSYISLLGNSSLDPVTGSLIFDNNHTLKCLTDPSDDSDAVNLKSLKNYVTTLFNTFLPLSGGALTGVLDMNSEFIVDLANAGTTETNHAVPLSQVITETDTKKTAYLLKSGGPVTNFNLNNHKLLNLNNPANDADLVNLRTMTTATDNYLPLSGGLLTGDLNFQANKTVTNLANPAQEGDVINKGYADSVLNDVINLTGTQTGRPITGNISFSNNATLTGLPQPSDDQDIVTLEFMNTANATSTADLLDTAGTRTMTVDLDLGGNRITNLSNTALSTEDLLNKTALNNETTAFFQDYLPKKGGTLTLPLTVNGKITGLANPSANDNAVTVSALNTAISAYARLNNTNVIQNINMKSHKITNASSLEAPGNLVKKSVQDAKTNTLLPLSGGTMSGPIVLNSVKISMVPTTTQNTALYSLGQFQTDINLVPLSGAKSVSGTVNMSAGRIYNLAPGTATDHAVNYEQCSTSLDTPLNTRLLKTGGILNKPLNASGFLIQQNNYNPLPSLDSSSVTLRSMNGILLAYISKNTTNFLTGNLDMNNNFITGLADAVDPNDAVNLKNLNDTTTSLSGTLLPISGGTLSGALDLVTSSVTGLPTATSPGTTALSYDSLLNMLPVNFAGKTSLGTTGNPVNITGDVSLGLFKVVSLNDPTSNTDAVNKQTLDAKINAYVKKNTSNTMTGNLDMNNLRITGVLQGTANSDLITYDNTQSSFFTNYLPTSGTASMLGSITTPMISNLASSTESTSSSAITVLTVKNNTVNFLRLSGGTMTGAMDMNFQGQIKTTLTPVNTTDPVTLKNLNSYQGAFYIKPSLRAPVTVNAGARMNWTTNIDTSVGDYGFFRSYGLVAATDFFSIENFSATNDALRIKKSGSYLVIITLETNFGGAVGPEVGPPGTTGIDVKRLVLSSSSNGTTSSLLEFKNALPSFMPAVVKTPSLTASDNFHLYMTNTSSSTTTVNLFSWSIFRIGN